MLLLSIVIINTTSLQNTVYINNILFMFRMSFCPFLLQPFRVNYNDITKVSPDFREYFCKFNSQFHYNTHTPQLDSPLSHVAAKEVGISFNMKIISECFHRHSCHGQYNPECGTLPTKAPFHCKRIWVCICGSFLYVIRMT